MNWRGDEVRRIVVKKYCTLVLKTKDDRPRGGILSNIAALVIAAITYQIIPADMQFAEVPLAAVKSVYQLKGIGHLMYLELRKRLQHVGVRTLLCWGDKESEGFWLKQLHFMIYAICVGFSVIGQVDTKGRVRKLPIKADIWKALCFPGGSNLMISHFNKDNLHNSAVYLNLKFPLKPKPSGENCQSPALQEQRDTRLREMTILRAEIRQLKVWVLTTTVDITPNDHLSSHFLEKNVEEATAVNLTYEGHSSRGISSRGTNFRIMLINIADDSKKANLTNMKCHLFLRDEDYELKYRTELKGAVLRAKTYSQAVLKGYDICLAAHVHPPVSILSAIVKSAGGNVIRGLDQVKDESKTIFVACEEDMDEALSAVKKGIWTFSSDWFMNCVMKQELDLGAPQFAESL
ncbi:hypothetical protein RND71_009110 [Anisodus tanguticus]|uniref:BRCT domain-containing protein n=1 Tax=Anisodus tanguticus TaxID=243964 RepID=A0AAE1SQ70_9SOLA|nr:hypothetical protein RND71_009110 [Anisodus tanguticus]